MSHSFHASGGTIFHYNPDLSGEVTISSQLFDKYGRFSGCLIPGQDLLEFIAEYVRRAKIGALENAGEEELLGIEA